MTMWLCRAGKHGEYENKYLEEQRIYCTWNGLSVSLQSFSKKEELKKYFFNQDSDLKDKTVTNWIGQIWPFCYEMKKGEIVVLPSKMNPVIHFGKIIGDYEFSADNANPYYHFRRVEWIAKDVPRELFDQDILFSFGAYMTICRIKQESRILKVLDNFGRKGGVLPKGHSVDVEEELSRDMELETFNEITNFIIRKTKGHGLARIVEAILKAKGLTTYRSEEGPDKGVDLLASPGILGFGNPKICVQVKSSDSPVDRSVLDQLGGVMKNFGAEYGLLVSWSGFKLSVQHEIAKQFFNIRLWSYKEIVEEFLTHYESMDESIKELVPLKKIWIINTEEK